MSTPTVSVIVPIYNVSAYLEDCLDSIANQTLKDIEVIMVNDGSTDTSGEIMDLYAEKYANFKGFHKPNGGLGQARNYGLQFATGKYIAFVDSDDVVAVDAYEKMVALAEQTGSDIVVGNLMRFNSSKTFRSGLHKRIFRETVVKTHITDYPELMYDTTAWNKLYRKAFWDRHQFRFPEGILYEDIPVTIPAHYLAGSVDILVDDVYYWRARDIDQSITQQRNELRNFLDRMTSIKLVDEFFESHHVPERLVEEKDYKWLSHDILLYLNRLHEVDDTYVDAFMQEVSSYLHRVSADTVKRLDAIDRLKYYLIQQGEREKLLAVLAFQKQKMKRTKLIKTKDGYYGDYPYRDQLPPELYRIHEHEFKVTRRIETVTWNGERLTVSGFHFINRLDMNRRRNVSLEAFLLNPETGERAALPVVLNRRPDVTYQHGVKAISRIPFKRVYNYRWSGYRVEIDFADPQVKRLIPGRLELWFRLDVDGVVKEFRAGGPVAGRKPRPGLHVASTSAIRPTYNAAYDLVLETEQVTSAINAIALEGHQLSLRGWTLHRCDTAHLQLTDANGDVKYAIPLAVSRDAGTQSGTSTASVLSGSIDVNRLDDCKVGESLHAHLVIDGNRYPVKVLDNVSPLTLVRKEFEARIQRVADGSLVIACHLLTPTITEMTWEEQTLSLVVAIHRNYFAAFDEIKRVQIVLEHSENGKRLCLPCDTRNQGEFRLASARCPIGGFSENKLYHTGNWCVYVETEGTVKQEDRIDKRLVRAATNQKLVKHVSSGLKFSPRRDKHGNVYIRVALDWAWIERGPRRQAVVRAVLYPLFRLLPMRRKTVVFESYWGKSYSCSPRALYEYMDKHLQGYRYVWALNNESTPVKGSAKVVRRYSWRYYYYLATAKYFVNNCNFPDFYEKRKGAVEIQVLHGTPLKTMGLDVPGEFDTEEKRKKFLRRCARWDYFVSPSRYVSGIARRAFQFRKEILEYGFPRNDILRSHNSEQVTEIKRRLGLPLDKKIILYAPTWRVKGKFKFKLDLEKLQGDLSDEYIVLLRLHYFVKDSIDITPYRGFAYNLSAHDDIQELYLISDILITDYSSVMFDYANLQRPILFFTYDLEIYRDQLRGFYIDFEREAPGPLARTTDELLRYLNNMEMYHEEFGYKLQKFRETYCEFDDGNACRKVVETAILGRRNE